MGRHGACEVGWKKGGYDFMKGLHSYSLLRFRLGMGFLHACDGTGLVWVQNFEVWFVLACGLVWFCVCILMACINSVRV